MAAALVVPVRAAWLAERLGRRLHGPDLEIRSVAPLGDLVPHALCFCSGSTAPSVDLPVVVIGSDEDRPTRISIVESQRPRLDFVRALDLLDRSVGFIRPVADPVVHPTAEIGTGVVLGRGVEIGAGTQIGHYVVIGDGVRIGCRSRVKSAAVIGEDGYGFERDEEGRPLRMVHLGSVRIGDEVEIGSFTTVCRGTLVDTVIEESAKIDDHVHIAHNCIIRRNAMIVGCAEVSGGVEVGEGAWVAPQAAILQKVRVGPHATVGIGAVVLKHVEDGAVVFGNPARVTKRGRNEKPPER